MQSTQYVFNRLTVIILYEVYLSTDKRFKLCLIEAFKKETTLVTEYFRFYNEHIWNAGWGDFQG